MSALIGLYFGTVTAGGVDGTRASESTGATPVTIGPLSVTANEESAPAKLAIRCDSGFGATGVSVRRLPSGLTSAAVGTVVGVPSSLITMATFSAAMP